MIVRIMGDIVVGFPGDQKVNNCEKFAFLDDFFFAKVIEFLGSP
jgi:hypothetical protein